MRNKFFILLGIIVVTLFFIKKKDMSWRQSILKAIYGLIMWGQNLSRDNKAIQINPSNQKPAVDFYTLQTILNNNTTLDFSTLKGKKLLLVNTASDCGYTGQYEELQQLQDQYKDKLVVIGFPANDFKQQEKGSDEEIAQFCKKNYGVNFQLAKKSVVIKINEQNNVFNWLSNASKNGWCNQAPLWNFSKYLVDENGVLIGFFSHTVSPLDKALLSKL